jgi:hypothetical protein
MLNLNRLKSKILAIQFFSVHASWNSWFFRAYISEQFDGWIQIAGILGTLFIRLGFQPI